MSKRNIIRISDTVKIVNPDIVIRCGYNLTKQIVKETLLTSEQRDSIDKMLVAFRGFGNTNATDIFEFASSDDTYDKILDIMAYELLKKHGYGGNERKLHTINRASLKDKIAYVVSRRAVKTGKYHHGGGGYTYDGEWDYEPAYLENEHTHVLFKVQITGFQDGVCQNINNEYTETYNNNGMNFWSKGLKYSYEPGVWIDSKNLIKYEKSDVEVSPLW